MPRLVRFESEFETEFLAFPETVRDELLASADCLPTADRSSVGRSWIP